MTEEDRFMVALEITSQLRQISECLDRLENLIEKICLGLGIKLNE
jgi:hypothetical protein